MSTDTLRHYETKGLIQPPPRQANGYRSYPPKTLERVQLVRRSLAIGFTLDEVAEILHVRDRGGAPCRKVRELAAGKVASIEERLRELILLRDELRATLKDWDARLAKTPVNRRAHLLESLEPPDRKRPSGAVLFTTTATKTTKEGTKRTTVAALFLGAIASINAQKKDDDSSMAGCPMMSDQASMNARGEKGMGFSQEETTHHFRPR